jgi:hypothetical protein
MPHHLTNHCTMVIPYSPYCPVRTKQCSCMVTSDDWKIFIVIKYKKLLKEHYTQRQVLVSTRLHGILSQKIVILRYHFQIFFMNSFFFLGWVGLSPLGTAATSGLLYQPQMIEEDDCGTVGEMKIGRGNQSTQRKPATAPLCQPQSPMTRPRHEPGGKSVTNLLSYGASFMHSLTASL